MKRPPWSAQARRSDAIAGVLGYVVSVALAAMTSAIALSRGLSNPKDVGLLQAAIFIPLVGSFLVVVWVPVIMWLRRRAERPKLAFTAFTGIALLGACAIVSALLADRALT